MPFCCAGYESSVRRHQSAHVVSSQNGMTGKKSTPHDDVQVFKFNLYSFMFTCGTPFCTPHFFTICSVRGHGGQTTTAAVGTHRATVFVYTATRSRCIGPVPRCRLGCRMRCDTGLRSVCSANSLCKCRHPSTVRTHHADCPFCSMGRRCAKRQCVPCGRQMRCAVAARVNHPQ